MSTKFYPIFSNESKDLGLVAIHTHSYLFSSFEANFVAFSTFSSRIYNIFSLSSYLSVIPSIYDERKIALRLKLSEICEYYYYYCCLIGDSSALITNLKLYEEV